MQIPPEVQDILKYYVYVFVDPDDDNPFYIGKGIGDRGPSHLTQTDLMPRGNENFSKKVEEITERGKKPRLDILRFGLSESEALHVEAAAIDLMGIDNLTNINRGHNSDKYGRMELDDLIESTCAMPVNVDDKAIIFWINGTYKKNMSSDALYEATRGIWKVNKERAEKAEYAMAAYYGVVKQVYKIEKWDMAHPEEYKTRTYLCSRSYYNPPPIKYEFTGSVADESICKKYIGGFVGYGPQIGFTYKNVEK